MSRFLQRGRPVIVLLVVGAILSVALAFLGFVLPIELLFFLCFGWIRFLLRVLPQVELDAGAAIIGCGAAVLLVGGLHWLLRSMQPTWRFRWSVSIVGIVLLMFVAGISFVGVTHQVAWLMTGDEPMIRNQSQLDRIAR